MTTREEFMAAAMARIPATKPAAHHCPHIKPTGDWKADVLQRIAILRRMPGFRPAKPNPEGVIGRAPNGLLVVRNVKGTALIGLAAKTGDVVAFTGDASAIKELHAVVRMAAAICPDEGEA